MDAQWGVFAFERQYRDWRASRRPRIFMQSETATEEGVW